MLCPRPRSLEVHIWPPGGALRSSKPPPLDSARKVAPIRPLRPEILSTSHLATRGRSDGLGTPAIGLGTQSYPYMSPLASPGPSVLQKLQGTGGAPWRAGATPPGTLHRGWGKGTRSRSKFFVPPDQNIQPFLPFSKLFQTAPVAIRVAIFYRAAQDP